MLKFYNSIKLTKSLQSKFPNLIQAYSINKLSTNDKNDNKNNKKKRFMDELSEAAKKAAEKLGLKTASKEKNSTENSVQSNSSYEKEELDRDKSYNSNLYNEGKENIRKGYAMEEKNPQRQYDQQPTYGSSGLGTSDGPCDSHTANDKKTLDEIKKTQNDLNNAQNSGNWQSDKQSQSNIREESSGGKSEAGRNDLKDNIYNASGVMESSKAEGFRGMSGAKKTPDSGSEFGSHGLGEQSRCSGNIGKDDVSRNIYGASGTGAINPNRYDGAKSEAENKSWDKSKNESEMKGTKI